MFRSGKGKMTKAYAAYNRNDRIRFQSSSGGVFHALAASVIEKGGVVFGVRFDDQFRAVYDVAEEVRELEMFQGAKYVFPCMNKVCERVGKYLKEGRRVLFTGLPCHVAGVRAYLRNADTDRLFCVDLVCHGTPENIAWESYMRYEKNRTGKISGVRMRDKSGGWTDYRLVIESKGEEAKSEPARKNLYMRGYTKDLYLRKPCYNCRFRGVERHSDITLGDYWGVSARHRKLDTAGGVSLVLVHSQKGADILEQAGKSLICEETEIEYACSHNPAITDSPDMPRCREHILAQMKKGIDFPQCIEPYIKEKFIVYIREKIRGLKNISKNR